MTMKIPPMVFIKCKRCGKEKDETLFNRCRYGQRITVCRTCKSNIQQGFMTRDAARIKNKKALGDTLRKSLEGFPA